MVGGPIRWWSRLVVAWQCCGEECCDRGASLHRDGRVVIHLRAKDGAVVDEVQLASQCPGIGYTGVCSETGEQFP